MSPVCFTVIFIVYVLLPSGVIMMTRVQLKVYDFTSR